MLSVEKPLASPLTSSPIPGNTRDSSHLHVTCVAEHSRWALVCSKIIYLFSHFIIWIQQRKVDLRRHKETQHSEMKPGSSVAVGVGAASGMAPTAFHHYHHHPPLNHRHWTSHERSHTHSNAQHTLNHDNEPWFMPTCLPFTCLLLSFWVWIMIDITLLLSLIYTPGYSQARLQLLLDETQGRKKESSLQYSLFISISCPSLTPLDSTDLNTRTWIYSLVFSPLTLLLNLDDESGKEIHGKQQY